ncbi:DsbA family oxidoreductase [Microbacterium betulae]|uniref:DsbA family oxidoreductase n=1 Tax=Microbacterium betulae TaxID=2981139 RepID=A0AA97I6P2_9MICO|nr:DsbA family oxidoreductase [Microbacterium sp. AB]WOF22832.1 DsbA family oxidoreductase [Microbacterium sp. AB]
MSEPIRIEVWSDVACPWCFIGKRRLEEGAERFANEHPGSEIEVVYRSFELSPDTPEDFAGTREEYLGGKHKGGSPERAAEMRAQMTAVAASLGLDYRMDDVKHRNTVRAHRLLQFARAEGRQLELVELLFSAQFERGLDLSDRDVLADLAEQAGLDRGKAADVLAGEQFLAEVREDEALAGRLGIGGVPFYVIDGRYGLSGAQAPDVFAGALERVAAERAQETV